MAASAILKMVEDAFYNRVFIIDAIVSNNDSTMRAFGESPRSEERRVGGVINKYLGNAEST